MDAHFRCVMCWRLSPWSKGCADDVDLYVSSAIDQWVWTDVGISSDGGVCDDCWTEEGDPADLEDDDDDA